MTASWLLDLTAEALFGDPDLGEFQGGVPALGEGRWTVKAAIDEGVPAHVLSTALFERFASQCKAEDGFKRKSILCAALSELPISDGACAS